MNVSALRVLSNEFPNLRAAASEVAALRARLRMPKGVVHVISDVHGEDAKLRHVINNASGRLRPLVARLFEGRLDEEGWRRLLNVLYYPAETLRLWRSELPQDAKARAAWVLGILRQQFEIVRALIRTRRRKDVKSLLPKEHRELFEALLNEPAGGHDPEFAPAMLESLAPLALDLEAVRAASRFIRSLSVEELVVAGDLGDRGPRLDRVVDFLMRQPTVTLVWGNHDVSWMGACLGQRALMATVLRISLRYRRLFQLEEGYGLLTKALENLAQKVYGEDPASRFLVRRSGERDPLLLARMQKAATILQLKLEGQTIARHPEWGMGERDVLGRMDWERGALEVDGIWHPVQDLCLPTVDPMDPNRLSAEEEECIARLEESFTSSPRLWEHMKWVAERGRMALVRDRAVIFHACLPVDEEGAYLPLTVDGEEVRGTLMFAKFTRVVKRAFRAGRDATEADKDWFWYLWAGPRSPLFGKDRMATFESYFLDDPGTHRETKGPWFRWIHDAAFCDRICQEMGVEEQGLIVNGHVPVRVEKGESPLKRGGNAVTIDGAFSEAYGDRGYTLILAPEGEILAEHHRFPDPVTAVREGLDIIPRMEALRLYPVPRTVGDTERGRAIVGAIEALEGLMEAYTDGILLERPADS